MTFNLIEVVQGMLPAGLLDRASTLLGETPQATRKGMQASVASVVDGLSGLAETDGGGDRVYSTLKEHGYLAPGGVELEGGATGSSLESLMSKGQGLLSSLFGTSQLGGMADGVSRRSGMKSGSSLKVLCLAGPIVMGVLGRKVTGSGLSAAGLTELLRSHRTSTGRTVETEAGPVHSRNEVLKPVPKRPSGGRYLVPALLGLLAVVGGFWLMRKPPPSRVRETVSVRTPGVSRTETTRSETQPGVGGSGTAVAGVASSLNTVLSKDSESLPRTLELNGVSFTIGSARLSPQAGRPLDEVASVLKQYPQAKVRLEGQLDADGNTDANRQLSMERAASVRDALQTRGVAASQLELSGSASDSRNANLIVVSR